MVLKFKTVTFILNGYLFLLRHTFYSQIPLNTMMYI